MTASEPLCVSLPNNACRELATIVTCTMHGLCHAPGSNHVNVSFSALFAFSFVISKYNLQSSDGTSQFCSAFSYCPVPFLRIVSVSSIVPFITCRLYPLPLLSRSLLADCIRIHYCSVHFLRIVSASTDPVRKGNHYSANICKKSKLILSSHSFFRCPVPFPRITSAPCSAVPSLSSGLYPLLAP